MIYDEMLELGLLNPEIVTDYDGKPIKVKDKDTGRLKTLINKKCQIANRNKGSKAKTYFVEEPIYQDYLATIG
jgi:hypothetical protein